MRSDYMISSKIGNYEPRTNPLSNKTNVTADDLTKKLNSLKSEINARLSIVSDLDKLYDGLKGKIDFSQTQILSLKNSINTLKKISEAYRAETGNRLASVDKRIEAIERVINSLPKGGTVSSATITSIKNTVNNTISKLNTAVLDISKNTKLYQNLVNRVARIEPLHEDVDQLKKRVAVLDSITHKYDSMLSSYQELSTIPARIRTLDKLMQERFKTLDIIQTKITKLGNLPSELDLMRKQFQQQYNELKESLTGMNIEQINERLNVVYNVCNNILDLLIDYFRKQGKQKESRVM